MTTSISRTRVTSLHKLLRRWRSGRSIPTLSSQAAYARWASQYPPWAHNPLMQTEEALMRARLPDLRGKVVLDLACGTGRYGLIAAEAGAAQVLGCDNSHAMLLRNPCAGRVLSQSAALPLAAGSVDVLLCGLAIGHLRSLDATLQEISRVLRPEGVALVSDLHPQQYRQGARRTFRDSEGHAFSVEHHVHSEAAVRQAAHEAGLGLLHVDEAAIPDAPSPGPAVIVYHLVLRG